MSNHFSVIGFKTDALLRMVGDLPDTGKSQPCAPGLYYRWQAECGAELWIHMLKPIGSEAVEIEGVTPFFAGEGSIPVRVMRIRQRPDDNAFEGAAFVEVAPGAKPHECATVALFDIVDYACWAHRVPPFRARAQVAAFPHSLAIFMDEETFALAQSNEQVRFASESLFASGLFEAEDGTGATFHDPNDEIFRGKARAYFTGRVLKTEERRNAFTGQLFRWALVKTLGGTIDVVTDFEVMPEPLREGMVIQGEFWLCARLVDEADENAPKRPPAGPIAIYPAPARRDPIAAEASASEAPAADTATNTETAASASRPEPYRPEPSQPAIPSPAPQSHAAPAAAMLVPTLAMAFRFA